MISITVEYTASRRKCSKSEVPVPLYRVLRKHEHGESVDVGSRNELEGAVKLAKQLESKKFAPR